MHISSTSLPGASVVFRDLLLTVRLDALIDISAIEYCNDTVYNDTVHCTVTVSKVTQTIIIPLVTDETRRQPTPRLNKTVDKRQRILRVLIQG